jgi:hypothetical protein
METTEDLAYHAKAWRTTSRCRVPVVLREIVPNDQIVLVHERRLLDAEDENEFLRGAVRDLLQRNRALEEQLRHSAASLEAENGDLRCQNAALRSRCTTMLQQIGRAHAALEVVVEKTMKLRLTSVPEEDDDDEADEEKGGEV